MSGRSGLDWKDGFPPYTEENLPKVNAMRRVASMVGRTDFVTDRASVLFSTAESAHDEPRSCFNCPFYKLDKGRCVIHSSDMKIWKFTRGGEDGNPVEYWPVCGYWMYGEPGMVGTRLASLDPDDTGLIWINSPKPGLSRSGANCGGGNDGDDCDYYDIEGTKSKMDSPSGRCRVLKQTVANGDCCNFWYDDDTVKAEVAQVWLKDRP